jgi:hypothetical protein
MDKDNEGLDDDEGNAHSGAWLYPLTAFIAVCAAVVVYLSISEYREHHVFPAHMNLCEIFRGILSGYHGEYERLCRR